jgi:hypothetical protein
MYGLEAVDVHSPLEGVDVHVHSWDWIGADFAGVDQTVWFFVFVVVFVFVFLRVTVRCALRMSTVVCSTTLHTPFGTYTHAISLLDTQSAA